MIYCNLVTKVSVSGAYERGVTNISNTIYTCQWLKVCSNLLRHLTTRYYNRPHKPEYC